MFKKQSKSNCTFLNKDDKMVKCDTMMEIGGNRHSSGIIEKFCSY